MLKVEQVRTILLATLGVVVVALIGYSTLYALNWMPGIGTSTGPEFRTLDRPLEQEPIEVIEFFSYACPHCNNLEPMLDDWVGDFDDRVQFRRIHVAVDTMTTRLAKTHVVLESQGVLAENHRRIFNAIHDRNTTFMSDEEIADFVDGRGIDREKFLATMSGSYVTRKTSADRDFMVAVQTTGVPAMLIGNKFIVDSRDGIRQLLDTSQWLVNELLAGRDPSPVDEEPSDDNVEEADNPEEVDATTEAGVSE